MEEHREISISKEISGHIIEKSTIQFVVPGKIVHLTLKNGHTVVAVLSYPNRNVSFGSL